MLREVELERIRHSLKNRDLVSEYEKCVGESKMSITGRDVRILFIKC